MGETPHNGICAFCGSQVRPGYDTCPSCGAYWYGAKGFGVVVGVFLLVFSVMAAIYVAFETQSAFFMFLTFGIIFISGIFVIIKTPKEYSWVKRR